jgi:iron complex transport system substrate-binding protein
LTGRRSLIAALIAGLGVACDARRDDAEPSASGPPPATAPGGCLTNFRDDVDYFPHKTQLRFAQGFLVSYHRYYKVVSTASRWQGAPRADTVVLLQCGAPREKLPAHFAHLPVVSIPVKIVGFNDVADFARMASLPRPPQLQMQTGPRMGKQSPDVVFVSNRNIDPAVMLQEARAGGGLAVATQNWVESTPLGRTEWIKHHALFSNGEADATTHFDSVATNYATLARAVGREFKFTRVFWGGRTPEGVWQTHNRNLESRLLGDAGGLNIFFEENAARFLHLSETRLLRRAENIDVWINDGVPARDLPPEILQNMTAVKTGRVFRYVRDPGSNRSLWNTAASVQPTHVLAELIAILHEPERKTGFKYFVLDLP